jgi:hypothetical protein
MILDSVEGLNELNARLEAFLASDKVSLRVPADTSGAAEPYQELLPALEIEKTEGPIDVVFGADRAIAISGGAENLGIYVRYFHFRPNEDGNHHHPDHLIRPDYIKSGALPVVIEADSDWIEALRADKRTVAKRVLKYVELKTGYAHNGPAWIARVKLSKSGQTVYFNGKALKRATGRGIAGNHFDVETREEYWVSGVKKDGQDRHYAGSGRVQIERGAVAEYLRATGAKALDTSRLELIDDLPETEIAKFDARENKRLRGALRRPIGRR